MEIQRRFLPSHNLRPHELEIHQPTRWVRAEEKAKREKEEAIQRERAAAEAREQARLVEEKRIKDEAAQRTADKEHRREVNLAAVKGLVDLGIPEQCARLCIKAIAQGKVPNTTINY